MATTSRPTGRLWRAVLDQVSRRQVKRPRVRQPRRLPLGLESLESRFVPADNFALSTPAAVTAGQGLLNI